MEFLFILIALIAGLVILYQLFALIDDMAEERGMNPWPWLVIGLFWTPFGSIIILWLFYDLAEDESVVEKHGTKVNR